MKTRNKAPQPADSPENFVSGFFAFPAQPLPNGECIQAAVQSANTQSKKMACRAWPALDNFGAHIPDEVRDAIDSADVFLCDITFPNRNVYYEAGYAIGR